MKKIQRLVAALMLLTLSFTVACNKPDDPNNGGGNPGGNPGGGNPGGNNNNSGIYNGHAYVDLGLPSGTLWATCNVGAKKPEEYGDYFAWGETEAKEKYNWSTYKYCNGYYNTLTKYCNMSYYGYNGFSDNLTSLEPSDDAATANWGDGWCMPTMDQWNELVDNTGSRWATQNGVYGRFFTALNGNSLFLPAAGSWWNEPEATYNGGSYWSTALFTNPPYMAQGFYFDSGNCDECDWYIRDRYIGRTVRPVRSSRRK